MRRMLIAAVLGSLLSASAAMANGVVKVRFTTDDGFFITGGSKITGNGSQFTVCDYFDAETGAFLGQVEAPGVGFDNQADLEGYCDSQAPR